MDEDSDSRDSQPEVPDPSAMLMPLDVFKEQVRKLQDQNMELQQQRNVIGIGMGVGELLADRKLPLLEAATERMDDEFLGYVKALHSAKSLSALPASWRKKRFRDYVCACFRGKPQSS